MGTSTAGRAAQAVALLAGFYLLALAIVAGMIGIDVALASWGRGGPLVAKIVVLTIAVAYPVVRLVFLTRRPADGGGDAGLPVTREQQPELWARVDRIAEQTGVRGPAEIRLVPVVNAGVREDTRLLGLLPGKRHLELGVPLLLGLTEAELDAVLAHEFGHYSNRDVRLAGVTVAGREALRHTITGLHSRAGDANAAERARAEQKAAQRAAKGRKAKPVDTRAVHDGTVDRALAQVFTAYAKLYFRRSEAVSRRQEYAADQAAVQVAGRDATAAALRRLPVLDQAYDFYQRRYVTLGWEAGLLPMPGQVYGGFADLLADPKRRAELAELGLELPEPEPDPYDSHPPVNQRIAAVLALPDDGRGPDTSGPASALLHEPELTLARLEDLTLVAEAAAKRRTDWVELVQEAQLARYREDAAPVFAALTALGLPATVDGLLDAVDSGRQWEVADRLPRSAEAAAATGRAAREFARPRLGGALADLAVLALAEAGRARWEFSWSTAAVAHLPEGLSEAVSAATTDTPDTAPLRALLAPADAH
ncbi:M48 family metallopeptidase [Kitasatospora sp. NPDC002227]|uniref:M48 family metallopeptidase n=1 Tax=Kitasatospora sp. NPDC002227 TaxID=3154773 RepID=UPI003329AB36